MISFEPINLQRSLRRTCVCGVMIAFAVILCRLLGFPQTGIWRVEISFLPIAAVALMYGPIWAGASYGIADLIGAAIFTGVNPFITLVKVLCGVLMGLFFKGRRKIGLPCILLTMTAIAVLADFALMALIFHYNFGYTWGAALSFRAVNAAVNLALRITLLSLCDVRLTGMVIRQKERIDVRLL